MEDEEYDEIVKGTCLDPHPNPSTPTKILEKIQKALLEWSQKIHNCKTTNEWASEKANKYNE